MRVIDQPKAGTRHLWLEAICIYFIDGQFAGLGGVMQRAVYRLISLKNYSNNYIVYEIKMSEYIIKKGRN